MGKVESIGPYLEPLRKSVRVACGVETAFELFTSRIGQWWPLQAGYSVFGDESATCIMEPEAGGSISEIAKDGRRSVWGRIVEWNPPHGLSFTWFPGRTEDTAQTVELRFTPDGGGTRLDLEHRDWQTLGTKAAETRDGYSGGWEFVLGSYRTFAGRGSVAP